MSGNLMVLIELGLVFIVAFGWGINELRQLRKYKNETDKEKQGRDQSGLAVTREQIYTPIVDGSLHAWNEHSISSVECEIP